MRCSGPSLGVFVISLSSICLLVAKNYIHGSYGVFEVVQEVYLDSHLFFGSSLMLLLWSFMVL